MRDLDCTTITYLGVSNGETLKGGPLEVQSELKSDSATFEARCATPSLSAALVPSWAPERLGARSPRGQSSATR